MRARCTLSNGSPATAMSHAAPATSCRSARAARNSASAVASSTWNTGFVASGACARSGTFSVAMARMSSSAPCAVPTRDARDREADERHHGDADDRCVDVGSSAERRAAPVGADERIVDVEVVAARAAQARDLPRVLDDDLIGREDRDAQSGLAAVAVELDAVPVDPVGVLAAAGEAPPPVHPVAAVGRCDRPGRVEHAGDDGVRIGEQRVQGVTRQPGEVDPGAGADHDDPAGRGIGARERLEDFEHGRHVGADAAEAGGPQQLEASRVEQLRRGDRPAHAAPPRSRVHEPRWPVPSSWTASSTSVAVRVVVSTLRHVDAPFSCLVDSTLRIARARPHRPNLPSSSDPAHGAFAPCATDDAVLVGVGRGRGARRHAELREDVLQMPADGVLADDERGRDLTIRHAGRRRAAGPRIPGRSGPTRRAGPPSVEELRDPGEIGRGVEPVEGRTARMRARARRRPRRPVPGRRGRSGHGLGRPRTTPPTRATRRSARRSSTSAAAGSPAARSTEPLA